MKRINVSITARMSAGSKVGLAFWIIVLINLPLVIGAALSGQSPDWAVPVAIMFAVSLAICLYGYFKCGVFYTDTQIIEKRYFNTQTINIADISVVTLDCFAGSRFQDTVVLLQDKNLDLSNDTSLHSANMFTFLFSKTPGQMQLKTVRNIYRKKNAYRFARQILSVIRSNGSANVTLSIRPRLDSSHKTGFDYIEEKFWAGFTEQEQSKI